MLQMWGKEAPHRILQAQADGGWSSKKEKMRNKTIQVEGEGLTVREIAIELGCSEDEVKKMLKSALQKLRSRTLGVRFPEVRVAFEHWKDRND